MMVKQLLLVIAACLWMTSGVAHAQVVFNPESTSISLNGEMKFIADDSNSFSLKDAIEAQRAGQMKLLSGRLSRGYVNGSSWLTFKVSNDGSTLVRPTLMMSPPFLDTVDVYVRAGNELGEPDEYQRFSVGDHTPPSQLPLPSTLMTVPLSIEQGASLNIFIHVHSFSAQTLDVALVSPPELIASTSWHQSWQSVYVGVAFALALINFLFAFRLRDRVYLMYGLYLLSIACTTIGLEGLNRMLLPQTSHLLADWFVGVGIGLTFSSVSLFSIYLFDTRQHHPWVHRYLQVIVVLGILTSLVSGTAWYTSAMQILNINGILIAFLNPWLAIQAIKRGDVAVGRLFLIAFGANSLGVLITILGVLGVFPMQEFTRNAVQFTSFLHMVVAMIGLAERVLVAEAKLLAAASQAEGKAKAMASEMNEELVVSKLKLEQLLANERKMRDDQAQFIDTISHEYRTPLAIVKANLDIMGMKKLIDDKRFETMARALTRLGDLFDDALQAHKTGKPPTLKQTELNLNPLLESTLADVVADVPSCPFECSIEPRLITVIGDEDMLTTALRNVLSNAASYRTEGVVTVSLSSGDKNAKITIDNSARFNEAVDSERFFDRGYSAAKNGGMGLGLYLVRHILIDHGGTAQVTTSSDRFVVTLTIPLTQTGADG